MSFPSQTAYTVTGGETFSVCYGPDGNIWFGDLNLGFVKMSPAGTVLASYAVAGVVVEFICSDGTNLWGGTAGAGSTNLARCTPSGTVTIFSPGIASTFGIVYEPTSGCLFIADAAAATPSFRKIALTGTLVASYAVGGGHAAQNCVIGPDGNLWGAEEATNNITRCTPGGTVTRFSPFSGTIGISPQPNGLFSDGTFLWACDETSGNGIWRITTAGLATQFSIATAALYTGGLGADGNLYVGGTLGAGYRLFQISSGGSLLASAAWAGGTEGPLYGCGVIPGGSFIWFASGAGVVVKLGTIPPATQMQIVMMP